ncbi:MAG: hypothetical protein KDK50_04085 [Chlamydiia bacterium]|nr:hypothetical protein [Chlamydiia bacterium]
MSIATVFGRFFQTAKQPSPYCLKAKNGENIQVKLDQHGNVSVAVEFQSGLIALRRKYFETLKKENLPLRLGTTLQERELVQILKQSSFRVVSLAGGGHRLVIEAVQQETRRSTLGAVRVEEFRTTQTRSQLFENCSAVSEADNMWTRIVQQQEYHEVMTQKIGSIFNAGFEENPGPQSTADLHKEAAEGVVAGGAVAVLAALFLGGPTLPLVLTSLGAGGIAALIFGPLIKGQMGQAEFERRQKKITDLVDKFSTNEIYNDKYCNHVVNGNLTEWLMKEKYIFTCNYEAGIQLELEAKNYLGQDVIVRGIYQELAECFEVDQREQIAIMLKLMVLCMLSSGEISKIPLMQVAREIRECAYKLPANNPLYLCGLYKAGSTYHRVCLDDEAKLLLQEIPTDSKLHKSAQHILNRISQLHSN